MHPTHMKKTEDMPSVETKSMDRRRDKETQDPIHFGDVLRGDRERIIHKVLQRHQAEGVQARPEEAQYAGVCEQLSEYFAHL